MFVILLDGSCLLCYCDFYVGLLCFYLGLVMLNDDCCFIEVDGQCYSWCDGEGVLFDEIYIYYVENISGENCLILFCDIEWLMCYCWVQKVNYWLGCYLMSVVLVFNDIGDCIGGINWVFCYIYQICIVGKWLKKWNKMVYYIVKWLFFGGIVWFIWSVF